MQVLSFNCTRFFAACLTLLAVNLTYLVNVQAEDTSIDKTLIVTDIGKVKGKLNNDLLEFKGIPYAEAPVKELRWQLPQPAKPWQDILEAVNYKSACPQLPRYGSPDFSYDEDCLYLNITIPLDKKQDRRTKVPVLVWIHGGAFEGGSSSLYPLDFLARSGDIIVISLNYRLGLFGFMAHPAFAAENNGGYGLEDQREALRWIKRNIAAFGGDPDNITIAGESAGAGSICMHIIAPQETSGLFNKAIIQSAACIEPMPSVEESSKLGLKVAEAAGCSDYDTSLSCLRDKSTKDLLEAASKVAGNNIVTYQPVIGTKTTPLQGKEAFSTGKFLQVPIINGGNRDELRLYVAYDLKAGKSITKENYLGNLQSLYGEQADLVSKEYPLKLFTSAPEALGTVMSDFRPDLGINNCAFIKSGQLAAKYTKVYQYEFADRNAPLAIADPGFELGAFHTSELPYQFLHFSGTTKCDGGDLTSKQKKLSAQMASYWTSFVKNSEPKVSSLPEWTPLDLNSKNRVMRLEPDNIKSFDAWKEHHCDFWQKLYPEILN